MSQPSDREHVLVRERDRLAEQLLGEQRGRCASVSVSSTNPAADEPEQEALERQQRQRAVASRARDAAVQPLLEPGQQQRLQRGDDEERVADERDGDVHGGPASRRRTGSDAACRRPAAAARTARRPAGRRCRPPAACASSPDSPGDEHGEPGDQRQRLRKRQIEALRRDDGAHDARPRAATSASGTSQSRRRDAARGCAARGLRSHAATP